MVPVAGQHPGGQPLYLAAHPSPSGGNIMTLPGGSPQHMIQGLPPSPGSYIVQTNQIGQQMQPMQYYVNTPIIPMNALPQVACTSELSLYVSTELFYRRPATNATPSPLLVGRKRVSAGTLGCLQPSKQRTRRKRCVRSRVAGPMSHIITQRRTLYIQITAPSTRPSHPCGSSAKICRG